MDDTNIHIRIHMLWLCIVEGRVGQVGGLYSLSGIGAFSGCIPVKVSVNYCLDLNKIQIKTLHPNM